MLITGKKNIRNEQLEEAFAAGDGKLGYAILSKQTKEILAVASTRDEIITYWDKLKCVIPVEDLQLAGYRRKGEKNHDKRRSTGKGKPRKGAHR